MDQASYKTGQKDLTGRFLSNRIKLASFFVYLL